MTKYLQLTLFCALLVICLLPEIEGGNLCKRRCTASCRLLQKRQRFPVWRCFRKCTALSQKCQTCLGPNTCLRCEHGHQLIGRSKCVACATGCQCNANGNCVSCLAGYVATADSSQTNLKCSRAVVTPTTTPKICPTGEQFNATRSNTITVAGFRYGAYGIAILGNWLIVVFDDGTTEIAVYDATTLQFLQNIAIPGSSGYFWGVAADPTNNFVYVSDDDNNLIFRIDLSSLSLSNPTITSWQVPQYPQGVSISSTHNLLVSFDGNIIQEYTPDGVFVQQLVGTGDTNQAVEVNSKTLVYSDTNNDRVCLISVNGTILKCTDSSLVQFGYPFGVAADCYGNVLVCDNSYSNSRVVVLNPTLSDYRVLTLVHKDPLPVVQPRAILLDEPSGRLFVSSGAYPGPWTVEVFDGVFNIGAVFYL